MKFLMPDSCLRLHIFGKFQIQKVQSFPRKKIRKKSTLLHTKNFHWNKKSYEYSNGKSGKSTVCTVILGNVDNFGDAMACASEIRSFSCLSTGSLWSETWLLFGSHVCFHFQWDQKV